MNNGNDLLTPNISIRSLMDNLKPEYSSERENWLLWPADVFAFTSTIMQRTGCYRIALIDTSFWEERFWSDKISYRGERWINVVGYGLHKSIDGWGETLLKYNQERETQNLEPESECPMVGLRKIWNDLIESDINIDELRTISTDDFFHPRSDENDDQESTDVEERWIAEKQRASKRFDKIRDTAKFIYELHAYADVACSGFGLINDISDADIEANHFLESVGNLYGFVANILLVTRGSLSTLNKFHGVVLPKMRTPRVGYTLRSTSHNVTFHTTEVEVIWRTVPWLNSNDRTLNILVIPHPNDISDQDFLIKDKYHEVMYFEGNTKKAENSIVGRVVKLVKEQHEKGVQVDIVVFPEMSLSHEEYHKLLECFHKSIEEKYQARIPIIIAGVISDYHKEGEENDIRFEKKNAGNTPPNNEVKIATYFSGRWYDVSQRKHHRWKLDANQIRQYGLQNKFTTNKNWFEYISVSQRRLTILTPNGWLALTALICEDLARLEPVSEVIRGIGPNFLTALLSDGPQITERWSARYASVLADDPGTSVLTLTSFGMAGKAVRDSNDNSIIAPSPQTTIGLWKDMIQGYKKLNVNGKDKALLLTISANYQEEFTLDERSDSKNASVFKFDGINELDMPVPGDAVITESLVNYLKPGSWEDIRQLSILMYALDASIDLLLNKSEVKTGNDKKQDINDDWNKILNWLGMDVEVNGSKETVIALDAGIINKKSTAFDRLIIEALKKPSDFGVGVKDFNENWPTTEVLNAFDEANLILKHAQKSLNKYSLNQDMGSTAESADYLTIYYEVFKAARLQFDYELRQLRNLDIVNRRIRLSVPIAVIMLIDTKILTKTIIRGKFSVLANDRKSVEMKHVKDFKNEIKSYLEINYSKARATK